MRTRHGFPLINTALERVDECDQTGIELSARRNSVDRDLKLTAMTHISAAWEGLAGFATGLTLLTLVVAVVCVSILRRLTRDGQTLAAAERLERVNLSEIMQRYLPSESQTQVLSDELPQAKQIVEGKTRKWRRIVLGSAVFLLCTGAAATLLTLSNERRHAAERLARLAAPEPVDPIRAIVGVWGWKYVALQSCEANPLTMTLDGNRKLLRARFAKPIWDGQKEVSELQYTITSTQPNELVMSLLGTEALIDRSSQRIRWHIRFQDANTYTLSRSDKPANSTGEIARCQ